MIDRALNYGRGILDVFSKSIAGSQPQAVLDIGAGNGADLDICRKNMPESSLLALESFPPNVAHLQRRGFKVWQTDLEKDAFPFPDESLDLVIANQILEHCKEIFWIFNEVSRTLKVGGYFYVGVPNLASLHSRLLLLFGRHPTSIRSAGPHVRGFTKPDFCAFCKSCAPGLYAVTMFKGSNFYPFPPILAKPLANLFPNCAVSIFFAFKKLRPYGGEFIKFPVGLETNFWTG